MFELAFTRRLLMLTDPTRRSEPRDQHSDRDHAAEARSEIEAILERSKAHRLPEP